MAETKPERVEIGFSGGQVIAIKLAAAALKQLTKGLEGDGGWIELETDDGSIALDCSEAVFVRIAGTSQSIGFGS